MDNFDTEKWLQNIDGEVLFRGEEMMSVVKIRNRHDRRHKHLIVCDGVVNAREWYPVTKDAIEEAIQFAKDYATAKKWFVDNHAKKRSLVLADCGSYESDGFLRAKRLYESSPEELRESIKSA